MTTNEYSPLFRLASKFLKYFLLLVFGFAIAYMMSMCLGVLPLATSLLPLVVGLFARAGVLLMCLFALVVILESLHS
jgi:hypothetical protein